MADYAKVMTQQGETVWRCLRCAAITADRTTHDTWHELVLMIAEGMAESAR